MPLLQHPGLSEEDVEAAEVLDVLRNSHGKEHVPNKVTDKIQEDINKGKVQAQWLLPQYKLLDRVRRNSIINNVVTLYEMNSKKRAASTFSLVDFEAKNTESDESMDDEYNDRNAYDEINGQYNTEDGVSKRRKISEAIAKSKGNLKEYQLNVSIESKKRLIACLNLLKLANKQLTNRVSYLQRQVEEERKNRKLTKRIKHDKPSTSSLPPNSSGESDDDENDDDEEFFDASESVDEQSTVIKMEVVGTVKKVYTLISKFAGNSLPEPARTQVRETLLNLPSNWTISVNKSSFSPRAHRHRKHITANGKVLILAEESLNVVRNVMGVVDCTLGKAEEWIKQKQEVKELLKERFIQQQLKKQIREQLKKERQEEEQ